MVTPSLLDMSWDCPLSAVLQLDNTFEGLLACGEQLCAVL